MITYEAYQRMADDALRDVVRRALEQLPANGPASSKLLIRIRTASGCALPSRIYERFPNDMSICIERLYEDLQVGRAAFTIRLYFDGVPEKLIVPYSALMEFYDPGAEFLLEWPDPKAPISGGRVIDFAAARAARLDYTNEDEA